MTLDYFPYKRRIAKNRERYINAYSLGLDTVSDWMTLAFMGDKQTPSRQALIDKCIEYSGIPYFDVTDNSPQAKESPMFSPISIILESFDTN